MRSRMVLIGLETGAFDDQWNDLHTGRFITLNVRSQKDETRTGTRKLPVARSEEARKLSCAVKIVDASTALMSAACYRMSLTA
jgi:hypothetical protein